MGEAWHSEISSNLQLTIVIMVAKVFFLVNCETIEKTLAPVSDS